MGKEIYIQLETDDLCVSISTKGAELHAVKGKKTNRDYLWNASPAYWPRHAPILFPIVGRLTEDTYYHDGVSYQLGQHGFARDLIFECVSHDVEHATFRLTQSDESRLQYPFDFELVVSYYLNDNGITVKWEVANPSGQNELPFAIGGHPAFNVVAESNAVIEEWSLEFDREIEFNLWKLNERGQFSQSIEYIGKGTELNLERQLFTNDALVFKNFTFDTVRLSNKVQNYNITMNLSAFKHPQCERTLGIWSPFRGGNIAPFVRIEPWFGYADLEDGPYELSEKPGMICLKPKQQFMTQYEMLFD